MGPPWRILAPFLGLSTFVRWPVPFIYPFTASLLHFFRVTLTFLAFSTQLFRTSCSLIFSACQLSMPCHFGQVCRELGKVLREWDGAFCQVLAPWNTLHCVCSSIALIFPAPLLLLVICDFFFPRTYRCNSFFIPLNYWF